ncbi:CLUMA_CG003002, isoform A [Clunio marinus]|uniref:CLUMA_CG003002, isoform A n=1 Tax=Clunio marinus TaxID=568069 RepID=A0A1J1HMS3_9DIPT|nr:CLUMA_CG003002, isoform A [Clunio marinus]
MSEWIEELSGLFNDQISSIQFNGFNRNYFGESTQSETRFPKHSKYLWACCRLSALYRYYQLLRFVVRDIFKTSPLTHFSIQISKFFNVFQPLNILAREYPFVEGGRLKGEVQWNLKIREGRTLEMFKLMGKKRTFHWKYPLNLVQIGK